MKNKYQGNYTLFKLSKYGSPYIQKQFSIHVLSDREMTNIHPWTEAWRSREWGESDLKLASSQDGCGAGGAERGGEQADRSEVAPLPTAKHREELQQEQDQLPAHGCHHGAGHRAGRRCGQEVAAQV